jgi:hypothetical protein
MRTPHDGVGLGARIVRTGNDFEVMLCNPNSTIELVNYFDPLIVILIDSTIKVHSFLKTGMAAKYEERRKEFDAFRQAVLAGTANSVNLGGSRMTEKQADKAIARLSCCLGAFVVAYFLTNLRRDVHANVLSPAPL